MAVEFGDPYGGQFLGGLGGDLRRVILSWPVGLMSNSIRFFEKEISFFKQKAPAYSYSEGNPNAEELFSRTIAQIGGGKSAVAVVAS